jgi:hypothetical protein
MASYSGDGVRVVREPGIGRLVRPLLVAGAAVAVVTALLIMVIRREPEPPARTSPAPPAAAAPPRTAAADAPAAARPSRTTDAEGEPVVRAIDRLRARRRATAAAAEDQRPELDARDVIAYLRARGEREGIAAFDPPGTDPPKSGILVPEDFPLPEGYVRHYQTDDDGQQLPAILMFHPDFEFVDEEGRPVPLPEDRVVPADLAPPGLPVRMLDVPARPARPAATP